MVKEFDEVVFGLEDTGRINLKNDADIYEAKCGSMYGMYTQGMCRHDAYIYESKCGSISQTRRPGSGGAGHRWAAQQGLGSPELYGSRPLPLAHGGPLGSAAEP